MKDLLCCLIEYKVEVFLRDAFHVLSAMKICKDG